MGKRRGVVGILAHVDAGKTTLSEAMLYLSGARRTLGRVDHGSAFLDSFALERERGITIFSKQAVLELPHLRCTLLDTPGHVDFSAEMERTLDVLDCAVLVVSAPAGVQSHTRTLWRLLERRRIPTLLFVNKSDLPNPGRERLLEQLRGQLGDGFFDAAAPDLEQLALCDEGLLEEYVQAGTLEQASLAAAVARRRVFPCWFGSALKLEGVEEFLAGLEAYVPVPSWGKEFGAQVFKITRDERGARLTHLKVTGGVLRPRDTVTGPDWEEKVTQLRLYTGDKYTSVEQALPGEVVAATGLSHTEPGMGLGAQPAAPSPILEPVLTYQVLLEDGSDVHQAVLQLGQLEEEDPQLGFAWDEGRRQLRVQLMGPVQMEVLQQVIADRFGLTVSFGPGQVLYRETIRGTVEGVGHYEPLRHYAEVHLLLEAGERGSGLRFASVCPESQLDPAWQRLILAHLAQKQHLGVLTGAPITDMAITLVSGRAHEKHTEGGDFRQATWRAVRQGLMQADSVLLEPWYDFRLEVPAAQVGRAITDLERMGARWEAAGDTGEGGQALLLGSGPAAALGNYPPQLAAYTRGLGRLSCTLGGYFPCADQAKVVEQLGYDPERDLENTPDSVFCSHGAGHTVKWSQVSAHMHLPSVLAPPEEPEEEPTAAQRGARYLSQVAADEELMAIFERTYGPVKDRLRPLEGARKSRPASDRPRKAAPRAAGPEILLVDGYNIIFAWEDLKALARDSLDAARVRLIERLRNYQGWRQHPVIVVFDAYKVKGNPGSVEKLGGVSVVYTKEAETADMYIEKAAYTLSKSNRVRVATSDALEQVIILGSGALRVPASAFQQEVCQTEEEIRAFLGST